MKDNKNKKYHNPVVILAGGMGTRLREETQFRPKPMVLIGGYPILWHIMKMYSFYGFYRFIICLGYKGEMIKDYFLQYQRYGIDVTVNTKTGLVTEHQIIQEEWEVTMVNTGQENQTGSRVAQISQYIDSDTFLLTYGDGLSNVNIENLFQFHVKHQKIATLTSVYPIFRFGNLQLNGDKVINFFEKKPLGVEWINGGFFVLSRKFFDYCSLEEDTVLERDVLPVLVERGQLMAYKHSGFWYCMDTLRDQDYLESLWKKNAAPWKIWQKDQAFSGAKKYTTQKRPISRNVSS